MGVFRNMVRWLLVAKVIMVNDGEWWLVGIITNMVNGLCSFSGWQTLMVLQSLLSDLHNPFGKKTCFP